MVTKLVQNPLGMGISVVRPAKMWVVGAIGAGVALASSLIGGAASASAQRRAREEQRRMEARQEAYYRRRYNEDYVDTKAGQNLVRRAKDFARDNWRKAAGAQAVAGGTDASAAMAKEAGNKMLGDTIANLGAMDTQRKAQADAQNNAAQQRFSQMNMAREEQRGANIANVASAAGNAIMSAAGAIDQASSASKPSLGGGSNNSVDVSKTPSGTTIEGPADTNNNVVSTASGVYGTVDDYRKVFG